MLPDLNAEHKKHLLFLAEQSSQVLQDFCKLAVEYLQKGPNVKLYAAAAQKLQVEPELIRCSAEALINLLLEARKRSWDELTFLESIHSLGFCDERNTCLAKLYEAESTRIDTVLAKIGLRLPCYHNLEWRLEVRLASRSLLEQLTPMLMLDLALKNHNDEEKVQHVLLQCDPMNLVRLSQELESAIGEAHTRHIRIVKRSVKYDASTRV